MGVSVSSTGYYNAGHPSGLDIPSGDFCRVCSLRVGATSNAAQIMDQYDSTNNNGMRFWLNTSGNFLCSIDSPTQLYNQVTSSGVYDNGTDYLAVCQRNGSTLEMHIIAWGSASITETKTVGTWTAATSVSDDLHILADQDLSSTQYATTVDIGEMAQASRALSTAEIIAMANGASVSEILGSSLTWYWPAYEHASATTDLIGGTTITAVSSSHATANHFNVSGLRPMLIQTATAGSVSFSATLTGTSALSGDAAVARSLGGTLTGTSALSGLLGRDRPLAATLVGTSALSGSLSLVGFVSYSATLAGTSGSSADVAVGRGMSASISGTSTFTAQLVREVAVNATIAGTSSLSASLVVAGNVIYLPLPLTVALTSESANVKLTAITSDVTLGDVSQAFVY